MRSKPPYFDAIQRFAEEQWDALERSAWRGAVHQLFREVQSPQHVISELLQNADDAGATWVSISIKDGVLVLKHDGIDFTEEQFKSLCSFAVSSKLRLHTIGFRGIGFKSTFSYGPRVEVVTPTLAVAFHQSRFTVPEWLDDEPKVDHTVIRIALNGHEIEARARADIGFWATNPTPLVFFRSIEILELDDEIIGKEDQGEGPISGSRYVQITGRETHTVLHIVSEEETFPEDALAEIQQERDTAELNLRSCRVELVLGDSAGARLYVVLPTGVAPGLAFSCNAPFLQDPGRKTIKDPVTSPTNRWLLGRIGQLAAGALISWLNNGALPLDRRAQAYDLVSALPHDDNPASAALASAALDVFWDQLEGQAILLTSDGRVAHSNDCHAVPAQLFDVWNAEQLATIVGADTRHLFASSVPTDARDRLAQWGKLDVLSDSDTVEMLSLAERLPNPGSDQLITLWSYLQPIVSQWPHRRMSPMLPIVPVQGLDLLEPAKTVIVLGSRDGNLTEDDWSFILRHVDIADRAWIERFSGTLAKEPELPDDDPRLSLARDLFQLLGLNHSIAVTQLVKRVADSLFTNELLASDGIRLARIAARAGVSLDPGFKFRCRDGAWRSVSDGLLVEPAGEVEGLLPEGWANEHILHGDYESGMTPAERSTWREWATSSSAGLWPFPSVKERRRISYGREEMEQFCRARGGQVPSEFHGKTMTFVFRDYDFDDVLWTHWSLLAATNPDVWVMVVRNVAEIADRLGRDARVLHQPGRYLYSLDHGTLTAAWVHNLRALPCVPDILGRPSLPAELLRVTSNTAFLEGVERFVHPDLDQPGNARLLDLLGVRSDPTSSDIPLQRLRALAHTDKPPLHAVLALYATLDKLASRLPGNLLTALRDTFQHESLTYATDTTWQPATSVVQCNDARIPGVLVLHPEAAALGLNLWNRIGIPQQPSLELVFQWLIGLPPGQRVDDETRARIVEVLASQPSEVWFRCGAWLDMSDRWAPASELRWSVQSRDAARGLFPHIRQATANLTMVRSEPDSSTIFNTLTPLESAIEQRVVEFPSAGAVPRPLWIDALGRGIARVQPPPSRSEEIPAPDKHPDREQALRLLNTSWQPVDTLKTEPYLGGEPAGQQRTHNALWHGHTIYAVGLGSFHHDELVAALASQFSDRSLQPAIAACIGRDPGWITDYLEAHFDLTPDTNALEWVSAAESSMVQNSSASGDVVELVDADNDELEVQDVDEPTEPASEGPHLPALPHRPPQTRRATLAAYLRALGYEQVSERLLRHPNGVTVSLQVDLFHGVATDSNGSRVGVYWVGDRALPVGFLIPAEVWAALKLQPDASWVLLPEGVNAVHAYPIDELIKMTDIYPATYRVIAKPKR